MRISVLQLAVLATVSLAACKKDNNGPGGGGNSHYGAGSIYLKQGTDGIRRMDMPTGVISQVAPNWIGPGWDISWDGKTGVKQMDPTGNAASSDYVLFNTSNSSVIRTIHYSAPSGDDHDGGLPMISPDGSMLALRPTLDDGLVIIDMNGRLIKSLSGYGSYTFQYLDPVNWAPDNTLLFKMNGALYRTNKDFSRASKVRDIPFTDWKGQVTASPDGKKIALSAGNHIWLMNADGSDFHVITESIQTELSPSFSPDSRYIAIAANSRANTPGDGFGTAYHLCLVPADGQLYKVYPGEDNRVIQPAEKGKPDSRGLGIAIVGDFVWRQ
ncbi:TolB family protein [Chitinophaga qingshengii]|uniref:PD40 domain-containing protein n=1 Tax=Chitinophaga qingshengii TaxID=1569794 RepID=A0ABR7TQT0_9BACT|nr:PD40 domain-containing protein [Chitinophaga qingshengii]MBC9932822.1 PD40 domain-containing protein [Chitinophaga qingshengii]